MNLTWIGTIAEQAVAMRVEALNTAIDGFYSANLISSIKTVGVEYTRLAKALSRHRGIFCQCCEEPLDCPPSYGPMYFICTTCWWEQEPKNCTLPGPNHMHLEDYKARWDELGDAGQEYVTHHRIMSPDEWPDVNDPRWDLDQDCYEDYDSFLER